MKKTPKQLIEDAGLKVSDLGDNGKKLIEVHKQTVKTMESFSDDEEIQSHYGAFLDEITTKTKALIKEAQSGPEGKKNAKSATALTEIEARLKALEHCDTELRQLRKEKRELLGEDSDKKPKTLIEQLETKLLSVGKLIPDELKDDLTAIEKTEEILIDTLYEIKKAWGLNKVQDAEKGIKDHFGNKEHKVRMTEHIYGDGMNSYEIKLEVPDSKVKLPTITIMANTKTAARQMWEKKPPFDKYLDIPIKDVTVKKGHKDYRHALPKEAADARIKSIKEIK